ncbi:MAG: dephospho-CoA kinase [Dysgonomonas sp.]|nr:dephospho-CoA kinase [Dysgonomonas sp.]
MIVLGITGGIGSGKSTVTHILKILGIPVYIADNESKRLTESSPIIRSKLIEAFGEELYDGKILNKKLFASIIFNDKEKLATANHIIHPEVYKDFAKWKEDHSHLSIIATEAAILFESGMNRHVDKTIMVYTPLDIRIERVMNRDNISKEAVIARINNQMPDEEKRELSDHTIYNDETQSLIQQTLHIIDAYDKG